MTPNDVLILTRREVASLLSMEDCILAVEDAFARSGRGTAAPSASLSVPAPGGAFHVKAARLELSRSYFAVKANGNFPGNRDARGLPTVQGVIVLCDALSGSPLAVMDSTEITALRTAAASAVAAKYLARENASVVAIIGCGVQGRRQLEAIAAVRPPTLVLAYDATPKLAERYCREMSASLGVPVEPVDDVRDALRAGEIVVTCTPARQPFVRRVDLSAGSFLAAVGADNPDKQELAADVFTDTTIVVDSLDQCAAFGDLHHALSAGTAARSSVHAELAEVVACTRPGRTSDDEVIIFDSTGIALEDVATAAQAYEKAVESAVGTSVPLLS